MNKNDVIISVRVPRKLRDQLKKRAEEDRRKFGDYLRIVMEDAVAEPPKFEDNVIGARDEDNYPIRKT